MLDINLIIFIAVYAVFTIATLIIILGINTKVKNINKELTYIRTINLKIQSLLKTKHATNSITENAEIVYQDLLQNVIPVMASLDIMPRQTSEHSLWRSVGSILDEYSKNPYVMEKLRRSIKLDMDVAKSVNNYINRAKTFLSHINQTEPGGILSATFNDGLLGQSIIFFENAKNLATNMDVNE